MIRFACRDDIEALLAAYEWLFDKREVWKNRPRATGRESLSTY
jgi:hypothetical protein